MNQKSTGNKTDAARRGIAVRSIAIVTAIVLALLHAAIILSIISINISSGRLSSIMQSYNEYISDATSLLAGSSVLSETASSFVLMPHNEEGQLNLGSIAAYASELKNDRRGHDLISRFEQYDVGAEAKQLLNAAAESAERMNVVQRHAIELVRSVFPLPKTTAIEGLPRYELSEEEKNMSPEEKQSLAVKLMFGSAYTRDKSSVSQNVNACAASLQGEMQEKSGVASDRIALGRRVLWVMTFTIIAVLVIVFIILYSLLVSPLTKFTKGIDSDEALEEKRGMREVRILANSYNSLRQRRILTERFLRSAASTDALTGMPNRLSFNHYLIDHSGDNTPIAIILFDVNNLKSVNDTYGHLAGDKLICDAAECISVCFDPEKSGCCFRFGGDEFAACLIGDSTKELKNMIETFKREQSERGVSIAYGYAYCDGNEEILEDELFKRADKAMYEMKKKMHTEQPV